MRAAVLIVPSSGKERAKDSRAGDLLDAALIETLRTLDGPAGRVDVLAPWTADLAPLIAAAIMDTAPTFDPERTVSLRERRSRLVSYVPPGEAPPDSEDPFWAASHLSLDGKTVIPLDEAVAMFQPSHAVVLGRPRRPASYRRVLRGRRPKVLTFASLVSPDLVGQILGVEPDGVVDLEQRLREYTLKADRPDESSDLDKEREALLEPYVPFSLLLQEALYDLLR